MKYTRYDFKKKNDLFPVAVMLLSVLLGAIILGTGISNLFIKGRGDNQGKAPIQRPVDNPADPVGVPSRDGNMVFVGIQSGFFSSRENADILKAKLKKVVAPFVIEDGNRYRVMAGIFMEEDAKKYMNILEANGFEKTKKTFIVNKSDLCDEEIVEIISGKLKILTELLGEDVSHCDSESFKAWVNELEKVDLESKNIDVLDRLKTYVNNLPKEINKGNVEESYTFLYNILSEVSEK
jgi:hypothetical protein